MKPILFNTEMVRAILDGRKTTTRRPIKPQPKINTNTCALGSTTVLFAKDLETDLRNLPYQKGNIIYVRETWTATCNHDFMTDCPEEECDKCDKHKFIYKADNPILKGWHPSIHMPKEAARIFLRVKDVRVERVQDITAENIRSEGLTSMAVHCGDMEIAIPEWKMLWDSTIKKQDLDKYGWEANPWVWVIEFEVVPGGEVNA